MPFTPTSRPTRMSSVPSEQAAIRIRDLGQRDYSPVWAAMRRFTDERTAETPDEVWLVEHPPVYTQGRNGRPEHLPLAGDIPVVETDRGGQITYHGPGQAVAYGLVDLARRGWGVRDHVHALEQAVIDVLAGHGLLGVRREDAPGIYLDRPEGPKIASVGLRVVRRCTYHGVSLNVTNDLHPFHRINPCGFQGLPVTRLADHTPDPDTEAVRTTLGQALAHLLAPQPEALP